MPDNKKDKPAGGVKRKKTLSTKGSGEPKAKRSKRQHGTSHSDTSSSKKAGKTLKKSEALEHWKSLSRRRPLKPRPVPYGHTGSTFDQDGIRITGTKQFVDSVLSQLTDLLSHENDKTRLQISYAPAKDKETGKPLNSYSCYVQVHERG